MTKELFQGFLDIETANEGPKALKPLPSCKGVLLLADANGTAVQLLTAANMRRTAGARLSSREPTTPKKRADLSRIVRKIYFC